MQTNITNDNLDIKLFDIIIFFPWKRPRQNTPTCALDKFALKYGLMSLEAYYIPLGVMPSRRWNVMERQRVGKHVNSLPVGDLKETPDE